MDDDEDISFTVVDELREDSQGSQENSEKTSKVRDDVRDTVNQSKASSSDGRKLDTYGLVEYSDDHTSILKTNETVTPVMKDIPAQSSGVSERTYKRKLEEDGEQQICDNDASSSGDTTSLSRVGQSILKRLKLSSSLDKSEQAHEVGGLMKNNAELKEEIIVTRKGKI